MLLTSAGLTAVSLLIVQRSVENQVRRNLRVDLANSVETFRNFQHERENSLARSAELMADLPVLKALMTSRHAPTIQDASAELFRLSGGDLFALVDQSNQIVGISHPLAGNHPGAGAGFAQPKNWSRRIAAVVVRRRPSLRSVSGADLLRAPGRATRSWGRWPSATRSTRRSPMSWRAWPPARWRSCAPARKWSAPSTRPMSRSCNRRWRRTTPPPGRST